MELQAISQVSKIYGISARMLRYYEQVGLIKSIRNEDNSYRFYDETALNRIQQIIILRKLQISIKQISDILNNQDAVTVIEVFKQNISEFDEKITALSAVKSILTRFIDDLQEKVDVQLKLDLLNDKTMIALVDALSIPISRVKEKVSMDELNKASEMLNKAAEKEVRIVYRPPATMACINYNDNGAPPEEGKARKEAEAIAKKFIEDTDLFRLKPDMRVFGFGDGNDYGDWNIWINIPDDLDVPAPFTKQTYAGGLYAACRDRDFDVYLWVQDSNEYEWDISQGPGGEEYFNPFNIYGLDTGKSNKAMYTDNMCPIREVGKITDEQKEKINAAMAELDKAAAKCKPVEIDLALMNLQKKDGLLYELNYPDGLLELKVDNIHNSGNMLTSHNFNLPLKIDVRAKTDKSNIHIGCALITVILDWTYSDSARDTLCIIDQTDWKLNSYKKFGHIPVNEFVDIECFFSRNAIAVRVNGELRHYGTDYAYVKEYAQNPEYSMSGAVFIGTDCGATVTVERLRMTEL